MEQESSAMQLSYQFIPHYFILEHILPKLPVRSLVKFKSVSKSWLSTITSYDFAKSHLVSSPSSPKFIIINEEHEKCTLLSYEEQGRLKDVKALRDLNFPDYKYGSELDIVGSSNGLVCLIHREYKSFTIWNPATRQCSQSIHATTSSETTRVYATGFGYVSSIDDFKIVVLLSYYEGASSLSGRVEVISLKDGTSKVVHVSPPNTLDYPSVAYGKPGWSVLIDDIMYCPFLTSIQESSSIQGVDVVCGKWITTPLMENISDYSCVRVFRVKGCLALACWRLSQAYIRDVWTLRQHDKPSSWEKLYEIDSSSRILYNISDCGKCLVTGQQNWKEITLIDPSKERGEESVNKAMLNHLVTPWGYVESLIWNRLKLIDPAYDG